MEMHYLRRGTGKPLLLVHGLGGSWRSWQTILDSLAAEREVIAIDLPGHGETPPLSGETSIRTLADSVAGFVNANNLKGVDAVGSSMGARLVLELARRGGGTLGGVVSLSPGGFWQGWQIPYFYHSINLSIKLVRLLQPLMPALTRNALSRSLLFAQFSARPWRIAPQVALAEMRSFAASPVFDELLYNLAYGEEQQGAPAGAIEHPLVIGWGRRDRVCLPSQSRLALAKFPDAQLHWFERCGHFPQLDQPRETVRLILDGTSRKKAPETNRISAKGMEAISSNLSFQHKLR